MGMGRVHKMMGAAEDVMKDIDEAAGRKAKAPEVEAVVAEVIVAKADAARIEVSVKTRDPKAKAKAEQTQAAMSIKKMTVGVAVGDDGRRTVTLSPESGDPISVAGDQVADLVKTLKAKKGYIETSTGEVLKVMPSEQDKADVVIAGSAMWLLLLAPELDTVLAFLDAQLKEASEPTAAPVVEDKPADAPKPEAKAEATVGDAGAVYEAKVECKDADEAKKAAEALEKDGFATEIAEAAVTVKSETGEYEDGAAFKADVEATLKGAGVEVEAPAEGEKGGEEGEKESVPVPLTARERALLRRVAELKAANKALRSRGYISSAPAAAPKAPAGVKESEAEKARREAEELRARVRADVRKYGRK